ncbi:MAG: hypothetical protein JWN44_4310 [Myxococcales bacterium]|nr:hypothetical protein [Myxococcales bacterium]
MLRRLALRLATAATVATIAALPAAAAARALAPDDDALASAAKGHVRALRGCYELAPESPATKGHVEVEVQPAGDVSDVVVDGPLPTPIASCVETRVRAWKFPRFPGRARRLSYSLVFVPSGP